MSFSRSLARESDYVEITPNAPRLVPSAEQANQLLPEEPSILIRIRSMDTHKSSGELIFNVSKSDSQGKFPYALIDLLHHPHIPHKQKHHLRPSGIQTTPFHMMVAPQPTTTLQTTSSLVS
jgi:hypothetical protein